MVSRAPDAVAVTVYRDRAVTAALLRSEGDSDTSGLAMITETRTVDLPAGRTRVSFQGVADEIIPASAKVDGLPGRLVERNFDYDLMSPGSLIARSVGQSVTLRRTNPKTGKATEEPATLRSGPDGVVVVTASGGVEALGCGAGPQALVFDHLPPGLAAKPTLSIVADAPAAGRYTLQLSYLAVRIDWSADYVARLAPDGKTLDLIGWLTLSNRSGASFANAPTSVVAGALARVAADLPNISPASVNTECWPMGTTSDWTQPPPPAPPPMVMDEAVSENHAALRPASMAEFGALKSEKPRVVATTLGDYKLYSLAEPTTLAARQTKQIRFLHQAAVTFEKLYVYEPGEAPDTTAAVYPAEAMLSLENKPVNGLGLPLPAGKVSLRQPQDVAGGRELFVGEPAMRDVPVGEPFELVAGHASDVTAQTRIASETTVGKGAGERERYTLEIDLANAEASPVTFEVRQTTARAGFKVVSESTAHGLKNGKAVWRVTLPANGGAVVKYAYEVDN
ncbi:MAG TPA: hypothetical protein VGI95_06145 [Caulobacteraceae bacterium]